MLDHLRRHDYLKWPFVATVPLLALGFGLSSFFTGTDTLWFAPPLLCLYVLAGIAFAPGFRHGWALPRSATAGLVLLFGVYVALSSLWSQVPYISILFSFVLTTLPLLFFALLCMAAPERAVRLHGAALFAVLCMLALWALVQFFFLYEQYGPRIHHPMLSPNSLAALFMIGLSGAAGMLARARTRRDIAVASLFVLLMTLALVTTQSRGGMIFSAFAMIVFLLTLRRAGGITVPKVAILALAAGGSLLVVNILSKGWLAGNLSGLVDNVTQLKSLTDRLSLYESSLRILGDHFWGGIGLGTFYFTYPAYRDPIDFSDGFFTHMDPLQYGLEMGIAAPVIFYAVLVAILLRTIRAMRALPRDSRLRVEIMAAFCAMLCVTIHTHIDFHLYILVTLIAMAVPLAWWYRATEEALGDRRVIVAPPPGRPRLWVAGFAVGLALLLNWPVRAAWTTVDFPPMEQALYAGRLDEARARIDRIALYSPATHYRLHQFYGRIAQRSLVAARPVLSRDDALRIYNEGLAAFDRAIAVNPDYMTLRNDRAKLYYAAQGWLIDDGYAKAEADLMMVNEKNPLDWDARMGLARLYEAQGYFSKAARVMERGREWPMPRGQAGVQLLVTEAELYLKTGDRGRYEQMMAYARDYAMKNGGAAPR